MENVAPRKQSVTCPRVRSIALIVFFSVAGASRLGATDTWTGGSSNPIWTSSPNWSTGAPPVVGDTVIMRGPGNTNNTANVGGAFPTWSLAVLQFASEAPPFTIHIKGRDVSPGPGMTISGGVINFSVYNQFLEVDPGNSFTPATPGALNFTQNAFVLQVQIDNNGGTAVGGGGPKEGGTTTFSGTASAGLATINNYGAAVSPFGSAFATGGKTIFQDNATGNTATISNVGGTLPTTFGGRTTFEGNSDAFDTKITNIGAVATNAFGGTTSFQDNATAGGATILNQGSNASGLDVAGEISFSGNATAGNAHITNTAGGTHSGLTSFSGGTAGNATISNSGGTLFAFVPGETLIGTVATGGNAIINNEGGFVSGGLTSIFGDAGSATINNNAAGQGVLMGGMTVFVGGTAGTATINNNGAPVAADSGAEPAGTTIFQNSSTGGNATINNNGGTSASGSAGKAEFDGTSSAGSSTIVNNGGAAFFGEGGQTLFNDSSQAGASRLIANPGAPRRFIPPAISIPGGLGGVIFFNDTSKGGTARVEVFGNGGLDVGSHTLPGVGIGSIQGSGSVFLGANNLRVGSNNRSTTFSGLIQDGGVNGGTGGSLTKTGAGALTLSNANTYTGSTVIQKGNLAARNKSGSATGAGTVRVNSGTLAGTGIIGGAVRVGNGTTAGAILRGGVGTSPGTLTINHTLTFYPTSTYKCYLNRTTIPKAGKVNALGVTINSNVLFTLIETGTAAVPPGTGFTVINNTSANPIFGRFSNLDEGSTFTTSSGTTYKVTYKGGTGNDFTLTVH